MNHFGNAFVHCGVVYYIDTYNAQSTTINFAYESQNWAYMEPQHSVRQSVRLQLHGGLKECCTPGTTSVWSLILSLPPQKKKETAPAQNCTEVKRFSFNRAENRVQLKSGGTRSGVMASPISLLISKRSMPFLTIDAIIGNQAFRDCAIIIRRGAEKLELSSKTLDSTPPPLQNKKKLVLTPPMLC